MIPMLMRWSLREVGAVKYLRLPHCSSYITRLYFFVEANCSWMLSTLFGLIVVAFFGWFIMSTWCLRNTYHEYCEAFDEFSLQAHELAGQCSELAVGAFRKMSSKFVELSEGEESSWW